MDLAGFDPSLSSMMMIGLELSQRRETGYDVSQVEQQLAALGEEPASGPVWRLFESLEHTPRIGQWAYVEPESLAEVVASLPEDVSADGRWSRDGLEDQVLGGWLGRIAGCNLGKPVENEWSRALLRTYLESVDAYPLQDYVPLDDEIPKGYPFQTCWPETTLGRIHGSARDDDIDYSILGLHLLERWGRGYTSENVAVEWLQLLPILQTGCERVTIRNLTAGIRGSRTATFHNPFREWIGAQIRADIHGWTNPGAPRAAALQSYADAALSHTTNGIYGEMWAAALIAAAFTAPDAHAAFVESLRHVPPASRLAEALRAVLRIRDEGRSWDDALSFVEDTCGPYHWAHTINNAAAVAAGVLWGDGDFSATIGLTVQAGMLTGSNGATAGSVAGVLVGAKSIPAHWTEPLEDRVATAVFGFSSTPISALARRTVDFVLAAEASHEVARKGIQGVLSLDDPRMWQTPSQLLDQELTQRREAGYDVSTAQAAVLNLGDAPDAAAVWEIYDGLGYARRQDAWSYDEPSDREAVIAALPPDRTEPRDWDREDLADKVLGGWLGRIAGCNLGKPVESGDYWTRERLRDYLKSVKAYPLDDYIPAAEDSRSLHIDGTPASGEYWFVPNWPETTRGRVHGSARDDDIDYAILGLHLLEKHGRDYTSLDVAAEWMTLLPLLQTYTAEYITLSNVIAGTSPVAAGDHHNPYREWIGALIRADIHGWTNPGNPRAAALQCLSDATLSHRANGIYGEMWSAALVAAAFTASDARRAVETSLNHIPPKSRLAETLRAVLGWHAEGLTWDEATDRIERAYGHYHWVHTINNAAQIAAGLLWASGDFSAAVGLTVQAGRDTDSSGATAGSVAGILAGAQAIPPRWVDPLEDRVATAVLGYDGTSISGLAARTVDLALGPVKDTDTCPLLGNESGV